MIREKTKPLLSYQVSIIEADNATSVAECLLKFSFFFLILCQSWWFLKWVKCQSYAILFTVYLFVVFEASAFLLDWSNPLSLLVE